MYEQVLLWNKIFFEIILKIELNSQSPISTTSTKGLMQAVHVGHKTEHNAIAMASARVNFKLQLMRLL